MPLIAPYVRVSYTALHTYRSTQTLIQSIRVDQARSALAFISPVHFWRGKHLGAEKVVEDGHAALAVPAQPCHCILADEGVIKIALCDSLQDKQVLADGSTFLPLLDYHYPYLVTHPRAELVSEVRGHAAYT